MFEIRHGRLRIKKGSEEEKKFFIEYEFYKSYTKEYIDRCYEEYLKEYGENPNKDLEFLALAYIRKEIELDLV